MTTYCKHCIWDIAFRDGTWVLAWAGPDDDVQDASHCDGSPDGKHAPAEAALDPEVRGSTEGSEA